MLACAKSSHSFMKQLLLALPILLAACMPVQDTANTTLPALEWRTQDAGVNEMDIPQQQLSLMRIREGGREALFTTQCQGIASPSELIEGSLASIRCWWAGGGDDYAAFAAEGGTIEVKTRYVDEESGMGPWDVLETMQLQ